MDNVGVKAGLSLPILLVATYGAGYLAGGFAIVSSTPALLLTPGVALGAAAATLTGAALILTIRRGRRYWRLCVALALLCFFLCGLSRGEYGRGEIEAGGSLHKSRPCRI